MVLPRKYCEQKEIIFNNLEIKSVCVCCLNRTNHHHDHYHHHHQHHHLIITTQSGKDMFKYPAAPPRAKLAPELYK